MEAIGSLIAILAFIVFVLSVIALGFWLGIVALWLMMAALAVGLFASVVMLVCAVVIICVAQWERWKDQVASRQTFAVRSTCAVTEQSL